MWVEPHDESGLLIIDERKAEDYDIAMAEAEIEAAVAMYEVLTQQDIVLQELTKPKRL